MTETVTQKKYQRLVQLVHKMREKQFAARYGVKSDIAAARSLEAQVDKIVKFEMKEMKSQQPNMF